MIYMAKFPILLEGKIMYNGFDNAWLETWFWKLIIAFF